MVLNWDTSSGVQTTHEENYDSYLWENQIMGGNNTRGAKSASNHGIPAYENIQ
jgi:hypothetical protein